MSRIKEKILSCINDAEHLYSQLILLVGESGTNKTNLIKSFAKEHDLVVINLNQKLSEKLIDLSPAQRSIKLSKLVNEILDKCTSKPIVLDNIEILFDQNLKQDPLRLLLGMSRNQVIIATWNGRFKNNRLTYAEIGHPEYLYYDKPDSLIMELNDLNT